MSQQGWCASVAKQRPKAVLMRKYGIKHCLFRVVAKCFSDPSRTHLFLSSSGLLLGSRAPLVCSYCELFLVVVICRPPFFWRVEWVRKAFLMSHVFQGGEGISHGSSHIKMAKNHLVTTLDWMHVTSSCRSWG